MINAEIIGSYYGYPQCCIRNYVALTGNRKLSLTSTQKEVGRQTGFIPCNGHAEDIKEGRVEASALIINRVCPYPFPQSAPVETVKEYLVKEMSS